MSVMHTVATLLGLAASSAPAYPYSPGKHSPSRYSKARNENPVGSKAARKGIASIPRGYVVGSGRKAERAAIGVNGIRGKSGGGR